MLVARDAYRKNNHLLTSNEIAEIRKKYKLSQADFSLALGWGEVTVTRYESKQIQDSTYDTILRLVDKDPFMFLKILESNRNVFTEEKYIDIITSLSGSGPAFYYKIIKIMKKLIKNKVK